MDIRKVTTLTLLGVAACFTAQAQQSSAAQVLAHHDATRQFQQRTVSTGAKISLELSSRPGGRSLLHIDIDSGILGDLPEEDAHTATINGILAVGLPKGVEFAGEPRMYWQDPASGKYDFMYSDTLGQEPWLPDLSQVMADATSNDPQRIYQGITALNTILDKRVDTVLPSDPRLLGQHPDYSVAGKSWIIPCNVMFNSLLDLFDPPQSLVKDSSLRMTVPVKITGDYAGDDVVVYVGCLSAAVARITVLPSEIPPDAIILVQKSATEPEPPPATDAPATDNSTPAQPDGTTPPSTDDPPAEPGAASGADAAAGEPAAEEPAPEEPVEALIYSFDWFTWETTTNLQPEVASGQPAVEEILHGYGGEQGAAGAGTAPSDMPQVVVAAQPGEGEAVTVGTPSGVEPASESTPAEQPAVVSPEASQSAAGESQQAVQETGESVNVVGGSAAESVQTPPAPPPVTIQQEPPQQQPEIQPAAQPIPPSPPPEETGSTGQAAQEVPATPPVSASQDQYPAGSEPGAVEIAPGTLPAQEENYVVPLKPITATGNAPAAGAYNPPPTPPGMPGTAPGMPQQTPSISAGQFVPPADLGSMVLVPEGYFLMGTSNTASAGDADELPQSQVYLPAYYIDKHLVTNRQFYAFVVSAGYKPQGNWNKYYDQGTADMPVRGVSWDDANAYARWAGKRLPTEAEWEKAARGTDGRLYPWGEDWSSDILPRGDFIFNLVHAPNALSPYGCQSMVGVLWQWTASSYAPYPYDPAATGAEKVLRGGCFSNGRNIVRCANRYAEKGVVALNTFGFRCARDA